MCMNMQQRFYQYVIDMCMHMQHRFRGLGSILGYLEVMGVMVFSFFERLLSGENTRKVIYMNIYIYSSVCMYVCMYACV
jgi:hypothetical protein